MKPIYQCWQSSLFFIYFMVEVECSQLYIRNETESLFQWFYFYSHQAAFVLSFQSIPFVLWYDSHYFSSLQQSTLLYEKSDFIRCYKIVELKLTVWMHWYLMIFWNILRNHKRPWGRMLRNFKKSSTSSMEMWFFAPLGDCAADANDLFEHFQSDENSSSILFNILIISQYCL